RVVEDGDILPVRTGLTLGLFPEAVGIDDRVIKARRSSLRRYRGRPWRHIGAVEVVVDLGREIDGRDVLRSAAVFRAQLGVEVDIGDAVAGTDPLNRVETPVDAEEDAAGGVLRGRLAEAPVVARED